MKIRNWTLLALLLMVLVLTWPVLAEETNTTSKPVEDSVTELLNVRDDTSLTEEQKLVKELEIRKKILSEVLILSLEEVKKLEAKLDALPEFVDESSEKTLQGEFEVSLKGYSSYYTEQTDKLATLRTIDEVKKLAQEIRDYRETKYNPRVQEIVNFVLIFYNEDVLKTANTRLEKISADVNKLEKLGYLKVGAFSAELKRASNILKSAAELNNQAKSLVLTPPTEEVVTEKPVSAEEVVEIESEEIVPTPAQLTEESLNKIKSAYDIFLQIGKDLRKALGIN